MTDWVKDIHDMHSHYGVHDAIRDFDKEKFEKLIDFRIAFLEEELTELKDNRRNPEEIVDALIDLCVVAIGTLDLYSVDAHGAWYEVLDANMNKEVGIKASRPNPLGLPDLIKPEGWTAPSHEGNHGKLSVIKD